MSQIIISQPEVNKPIGICEAINCSEAATEEIQLDAGTFGILTFSVCCNCVSKFNEVDQK